MPHSAGDDRGVAAQTALDAATAASVLTAVATTRSGCPDRPVIHCVYAGPRGLVAGDWDLGLALDVAWVPGVLGPVPEVMSGHDLAVWTSHHLYRFAVTQADLALVSSRGGRG